MYKILLADNEGIVLDALIHMIYSRFGETCDIRSASTTQHLRILARKFIPDIAVINVQMPGMHGFEVVREIRSYHLKCVFITVSTYDRQMFRLESESLNLLSHLAKPLFREKIMPVLEQAASIVDHAQKRAQQNSLIQEKFDVVVPALEHGLINQLFFPDGYAQTLDRYKTLLGLSQNYGRLVTLTFGEPGEPELPLQNPVGAAIHVQKDYMKFRELVREYFPLSVIGPVMGNHILFILPCWKSEETIKETKEFTQHLAELTEVLGETFDNLAFTANSGEICLLRQLHIP